MNANNKNQPLKEETRQAILRAAMTVLGRFGYPKTSMVDVAREAGISRATLYLYFSSKEEIALASMDRVNDELRSLLREAAARLTSAESRLRDMIRLRVIHRFDFAARLPQSIDDVYRDIRTSYLARRDDYDAIERSIFMQILDEGRSAGEFEFANARETAATLLSCTNALLPFSLSPRELQDKEDVLAQVDRTTDLLLRALRPLGGKK